MRISVTVKTTIAVMLSALVLVLIGGMLRWQSDLELSSSELVHNTESIISQLDTTYAALVDLENAEHAYVLAPTPSTSRRYELAVTQLQGLVEHLQTLNFAQRKQEAHDLMERIDYRISVGKDLLDFNRLNPDFKGKELKYIDETGKLSSNVRGFIDDLKHFENELLFRNQQQLKEATISNNLAVNTLLSLISGVLIAIWIFVVRYVSERQRAETSLRLAEEKTKAGEARMRSIVETAPDGIITIAQSGTIESANAAMQQIFGYGTEELIGKDVALIIKGFFEAIGSDCFNNSLQTGERRLVRKDLELVGELKDGGMIPVELAISVLNLGDRQILNAVVRDITERKEVEKRVSEFYATVSHELRTPLTSIRTALGLMESGSVVKLPGKAGQLIRIARSECDRLIRLINDILDIRKIESGKMALKPQEVEPEALIEVTLSSLRSIARESDINLLSDVTTRAELRCDVDRIVQVLTNLVSNAIRFSPRGATVIVRAEKQSTHGPFRFSIIDKGPGIPVDQVHKLWDRFEQLDVGVEGKSKGGTGLGLAITKAIVTQHGGTVGVETSQGKGSSFWFELPEIVADENEVEERLASQDRRRILLIDDDDEMFDLLNGLIAHSSYELVRAGTIGEANRLLNERRPDMVLLEVQLPDGNGFDLISSMLLDTTQPTLPIVVLPGREPSLHTLGNPVLIDWLIKPEHDEALQRCVRASIPAIDLDRAKAMIVSENKSTLSYLRGKLQDLKIECLCRDEKTGAKLPLEEDGPDFIVLDIEVGQQVCFEIFQTLRQEKLRTIPLLVYADKILQQEDLDKFTLAFSRYLSKSHMSEPEFLAALRQLLDGRLHVLGRQAALHR